MTKWKIAPFAVALALFAATPAQAQIAFGPQVSWGSDSDLGVGARVEVPIGYMVTADDRSVLAGLKLIASGDYFFLDCDNPFGGAEIDCSYIEINANGAVPLPLEGFSPYVGGGLNVALVSVDVEGCADCGGSDTEVGLNVLGGLNFPLGGMNAFAEGRFELGGGEQFVLSAGILF